ncbi:hypothetical protein K493DRAFT_316663 [Basidiobolus meristosporus CBS 931.73]|uniref:Uncharacterized protein n=1 Tax=Basidiobolus meristosporus CBS 931.73 TaxID=1314790 RepID=A0A1Y1Y2S5_9FUNG|nr:hypothetical protein K493DRAFT_316663 [Basidiobolus meristosporus CBS 931.73]|eukprot:ORX92300.1 hypothetical protein K493DRAFT_316663 [Basidiobolus meristosporus CBS 931.73]
MDSQFTYLHQRSSNFIDIVDEKWRKDELPADDIAIPENLEPPHLDDLPVDKEADNKWNDLELSLQSDSV